MDDRKINFETLIGEMLTCHTPSQTNPVCPKCKQPAAVWTGGICGGCYIASQHEGEPIQ